MKIRNRKKKVDTSIQGAVCVIDGDQGIRNSLYILLGTLGVRVVTFASAEEFLRRLNGERPAFLIAEVSLPGMSAFQLKEALDRLEIQIPMIGLTGEENANGRKEASRLGFLDLVEKPFVYWSVVERVQEVLQPSD